MVTAKRHSCIDVQLSSVHARLESYFGQWETSRPTYVTLTTRPTLTAVRITMECKRDAPLRGCQLCSKCGRSNGNRAYACKFCHEPLSRKEKSKAQKRPRECSDVSDLTHEGVVPPVKRTFSVRQRKAGPDYRTFVCQQSTGMWKCYAKDCSTVQDARSRSDPNSSADVAQYICEHVKCVQQQMSDQTIVEHPLFLNVDVLTTLPIPADVAHELKCTSEKTTTLIRRVSEGSFAIRLPETSQEQPLGVLHIRFTKPSQSPVFYCPCHSFQSSNTSGPTTARLSRRCSHFYICLWAFASDKSLSEEFHHLLQALKGMELV